MRRGVALPMVLLVLAAVGLLSALLLADALQAWRAAQLATDAVRARAASVSGIAGLLHPVDLPWLCLQSPSAVREASQTLPAGAVVTLRWWHVGRGRVRGEVEGRGRHGGRHRRIALMRPDSLPTDSLVPGCPLAGNLRPAGGGWIQHHPDG